MPTRRTRGGRFGALRQDDGSREWGQLAPLPRRDGELAGTERGRRGEFPAISPDSGLEGSLPSDALPAGAGGEGGGREGCWETWGGEPGQNPTASGDRGLFQRNLLGGDLTAAPPCRPSGFKRARRDSCREEEPPAGRPQHPRCSPLFLQPGVHQERHGGDERDAHGRDEVGQGRPGAVPRAADAAGRGVAASARGGSRGAARGTGSVVRDVVARLQQGAGAVSHADLVGSPARGGPGACSPRFVSAGCRGATSRGGSLACSSGT